MSNYGFKRQALLLLLSLMFAVTVGKIVSAPSIHFNKSWFGFCCLWHLGNLKAASLENLGASPTVHSSATGSSEDFSSGWSTWASLTRLGTEHTGRLPEVSLRPEVFLPPHLEDFTLYSQSWLCQISWFSPLAFNVSLYLLLIWDSDCNTSNRQVGYAVWK